MHTLTIYGTPEDQIKVEGDFEEELGLYEMQDSTFLAISGGTLLSVRLDEEEVWRIDKIAVGLDTGMEKEDGTSASGSDTIRLASPVAAFEWILMGTSLAGAN